MSSALFQRAIFKRTLLLTIISSSGILGTQARTVQLGIAMKTYQVILLSCWGLIHSCKVETKCSADIKTWISVFHSYFQKTIKTTYLRFCLVLSDSLRPMDCILPGFLAHGIFQATVLEWLAVSSSRRSSQPRDWGHISCISWNGRQIHYHWETWEAQNYILPRHKLEMQVTFHVPLELWD